MQYPIIKRIPQFLLLAILTFVYACTNSVEPEQSGGKMELNEEQIFELLMSEIAVRKKQSSLTEVDRLDGKNAEDYFREWQQDGSRMACMNPPNCPAQFINDVFSFNGCILQYSYKLYNCGNGLSYITDLQLNPAPGDCPIYDNTVIYFRNIDRLEQAQVYSNLFKSLILRNLENNLLTVGGQTTVTTYIPNICAASCQSNGAQEECGEDCCIRVAISLPGKDGRPQRTTNVYSAGECGGNMVTCQSTGFLRACENFDCPLLDQ